MSGNGEGEGLQISNVAESMGDILNSLSTSASVGSDKTAGLLTAVFQSETVREATGLDIKTATEMANAATNAPDGGEVDYKGTLVSVGSSIDAVMNLGKDGKELTVEEAVELIRNINPQTAAMIEIFVTADRLAGYGVPSDYSEISASLIGGIFHYMGNEQLDDYEAEANALNQILNIALTASDNTSTGKKYLYNNNTDGTVDPQAILPGNAADTVNTFMSSHAISYAIRDTMLDENGNVIEGRADAFGLAGKMNEESNDYQATIDAIEAYYAEHNDVETRDTLRALAALLGVEFTA